jgi:hypothetical protein
VGQADLHPGQQAVQEVVADIVIAHQDAGEPGQQAKALGGLVPASQPGPVPDDFPVVHAVDVGRAARRRHRGFVGPGHLRLAQVLFDLGLEVFEPIGQLRIGLGHEPGGDVQVEHQRHQHGGPLDADMPDLGQ